MSWKPLYELVEKHLKQSVIKKVVSDHGFCTKDRGWKHQFFVVCLEFILLCTMLAAVLSVIKYFLKTCKEKRKAVEHALVIQGNALLLTLHSLWSGLTLMLCCDKTCSLKPSTGQKKKKKSIEIRHAPSVRTSLQAVQAGSGVQNIFSTSANLEDPHPPTHQLFPSHFFCCDHSICATKELDAIRATRTANLQSPTQRFWFVQRTPFWKFGWEQLALFL